jgi:hypothetical protein
MGKQMCRTFLIAVFLLLAGQAQAAEDTHIRGWLEHARVMPDRLLMTAKLDSGARTTSIHAEILFKNSNVVAAPSSSDEDESEDRMVEELGAQPDDDPPGDEISDIQDAVVSELMPETITFKLTSKGGKEIVLTEKVVRWVSIRRRGGGSIVRPVVMLDLCIAGRVVRGEVNLADRSGFNYPLLIGRNMLKKAAISIDAREIFAEKRACPPGV